MNLIGASGHCKVIIDILEENKIEIKSIYDDDSLIKIILDYPVSLVNDHLEGETIITIGDNKIRKEVSERLNCEFGTAIHPSSEVSKYSAIDEGTVVMAGVVINASTNIGKHCIINSNSVIEHDCRIGDFVHVSPNASVTGNIQIGVGTHVGTGAVIIPNIRIGKWVTIGAGAVVINNVPDYAVVVGNPAKIIKYNKK